METSLKMFQTLKINLEHLYKMCKISNMFSLTFPSFPKSKKDVEVEGKKKL